MQFEKYPFQKLSELLEDITPNESFSSLTLTIGEPQFDTPDFIQKALCDNSHLLNKYPSTAGDNELVLAQMEFVKNRYNIELLKNEILPVNGTREVLFNFPAFLQPSKIAFPNPFYQIYEGAAIAVNAKINMLPLTKENGFKAEIANLQGDEELVILNTPNNPTNSVMEMDELCEWVELALKNNFIMLSDECYSEIYFDTPPPSILEASIKVGNRDFKNILAINSISKRSSAPSLRSGYIAGDKTILKDYLLYRTYVGCASPLPLQKASAKAWRDENHVKVFREKYLKNFQIAKEILGVEIPKASFYLWLEVENDIEFTKFLYEKYNLKIMPGTFMSRENVGSGYIRVPLVYDEELMRESLKRLKDGLDEFKK